MTQEEAFKAWWYNEGSQVPYTHHDCEEHTMRMCEVAWNKAQSLAQPKQEPVIDKSAAIRIATSLGWEPKRTWVDVPDEEIKRLWIQYRAALPRYLCFAKALLARSKEKNT